ncbi:MAG: thioesterase [Crocinitomicaceae bacterium]|nr:thioesterase [Crocinitomicaceae bacterium]|tara:strand:- start:32 stop:454 length:423 start_codon:yes stop_codon:yes gene_type:complete
MIPTEIEPEHLNIIAKDTLLSHLEIEFTEVAENYIIAKMPVNQNTSQPMGILHGGASVALAESIGSIGSYLIVEKDKKVSLGLEINANHVGSAYEGYVYGKGEIIHKGKSTHIWSIEIRDEKNKLISICRLTIIIINRKT